MAVNDYQKGIDRGGMSLCVGGRIIGRKQLWGLG